MTIPLKASVANVAAAPKMDIMNLTDHQIDQDDDEDTVFVGDDSTVGP